MCDFFLVRIEGGIDTKPLYRSRVYAKDWSDTPPGSFLSTHKPAKVWLLGDGHCSCGFREIAGDRSRAIQTFLTHHARSQGGIRAIWITLDGSVADWRAPGNKKPIRVPTFEELLQVPTDQPCEFDPDATERLYRRRQK